MTKTSSKLVGMILVVAIASGPAVIAQGRAAGSTGTVRSVAGANDRAVAKRERHEPGRWYQIVQRLLRVAASSEDMVLPKP